MSALDQAIEQAQLGTATSQPRRSFTAARDRGVLTTRRAARPWAYALWFLRGGLVLAETAVGRVEVERGDELRIVTIDVALDEKAWPAVELGGLLEASLSESNGSAVQRWRHRVGTAVNGALAAGPRWVELHTPGEARRWERGPEGPAHVDPYRARRIASLSTGTTFMLRVAQSTGSFGSTWRRWTGQDDPAEHVARLWQRALSRTVTSDDAQEGVAIARAATSEPVVLGECGRWWPDRDTAALLLRREGVVIADLTAAVDGLIAPRVRGVVECGAITLDADGQRPVRNEALHELAAWLEAAVSEVGEGLALKDIGWPQPQAVVTSSGDTRVVAELRASDEVIYAWPHRAFALRRAGVPAMALFPHAVAWLERHTPASMVPASAFALGPELQRVDLASLAAGAFDPLELGREPTTRAYVHRHAVAAEGVVELHAWGRRLQRATHPQLHGVTVIVELDPATARDRDAWPNVVALAVGRVNEHANALTRAVLAAVPDEAAQRTTPWIEHRIEQLTASGLALSYAPHERGVRLTWRDDPLLALVVAHERDGTPRTLRDALVRHRDVGGIVIGEVESRWRTLESEVPAWSTWILTARGRVLLEAVVGSDALWTMPMVPEAQLRPAALTAQSHVRRAAHDVLSAAGMSTRGRSLQHDALLAHALHARATEQEDHGASAAHLLTVYDPSALHPRRLCTLIEVAGIEGLGIVPPGVAHRDLGRAVIEASPAFAYALVELGVAHPAPHVTRPVERAVKAAVTRETSRTWIRHPIAHRLGAGAVTLSEEGGGVELWAKGLRSTTLKLPAPWQGVTGRVWMSQEGMSADPSALRNVVMEAAIEMRAVAQRAAALSIPGSDREAALRSFVEATASSATQVPPRPVRVAPSLGSDRLAAVLRFALGRALSVDDAILSWTLVKADENLQTLQLGARHALIRAARSEHASTTDIAAAALAITYTLGGLGLDPRDRDTAMARILAALE